MITSNGSILLPRQNFLDFVSPHGSPESDVEVSSGNLGQAALASDGTIYIGDDGAHLFALDSSGCKNGKSIWAPALSAHRSSMRMAWSMSPMELPSSP